MVYIFKCSAEKALKYAAVFFFFSEGKNYTLMYLPKTMCLFI